MALKAANTPVTRLVVARMMLIVSALLILFSIVFGVYLVMAEQVSPVRKYTPKIVTSQQSMSDSDKNKAAITTISQQFVNALIQQHYDAMWSMLDSQMQAKWAGEDAFANYYKVRFQDYKLQSSTAGVVRPLAQWTDPETMKQYNNVFALPVSLQLDSQLTQQQQSKLASQFQKPSQIYQNVPMIIQTGLGKSWTILSGGPVDPEAPIIPPFTPVQKKVNVPILMYHHISDTATKNALDLSLTVKPIVFAAQLDYLKSKGYQSITLNQLMSALYFDAPLPKKPIILTFDDGYDDAYKFAYPILRAHGYTGMFYIITGKVGWQGQMTWNQMREMLANGMQMGDHTIHHIDMGNVYRASPLQAQQEVQVSLTDLQKNLNIIVQHFCYPSGAPFKGHDIALQNAIMSLLATSGYVDATTDPGPTGVTQNSLEPFKLLRLRIDGRETIEQYKARFL